MTKVQEIQKLLYGLLQVHIFNIEGEPSVTKEGLPDTVVSKSILLEKLLVVLNEFGETLSQDSDEVVNEINSEESN